LKSDLVVLDITMPIVDGFEAALHLNGSFVTREAFLP